MDSLTEKGWQEAALLADALVGERMDAVYVSPLGRAQDTARPFLERRGQRAETLPWLEEFRGRVVKPGDTRASVAWDWLPDDWTKEPRFYHPTEWMEVPAMKEMQVGEEYKRVTEGLDALLAKHGYVREGMTYRVEKPNDDTVVLVCHFGLLSVLLSHLLGVSPMPLWHGTVAAPTSVTKLTTEERREGTAAFRMSTFGDTSHLYVAGEKPAFAARFCERFTDDTRHD
ncbi:MAG: histidine phosphatase family protein [Clostridia bacterium]|nr:histidine phosphatase family protein [Clostridia bacterium]